MQSYSTEETVLDSNANKKNYITSEKVSLENVLSVIKNPIILHQTETFKTNYSVNTLRKSTEKTNVYFTKIVKGDEYTTYLLLLNRYSKSKPYFMYYIITDRDNVQKAAFVKYIPDAPSILLDQENFTGKIQMLDTNLKIRLDSRFVKGQFQKNNTALGKMAEYCTTTITYIVHLCTNGGNHTPEEDCGKGTNDAYYEYIGISGSCVPTESGYDNSAPLPKEFVNGSDGIGGGGANADYEVFKFEQLLNTDQKLWWDSPRNDSNKKELTTFLILSPSDEAKAFALEAINGYMTSSEVDLAYRVIIDKSLKDNTNLYGVYTQLGKAPAFQVYLQKFDNNFSITNLNFRVDDTFKINQVEKHWKAQAITLTPENNLIKIIINNDPSLPGNIMKFPKIISSLVFIHEMIHAEIYRILLSCSTLPNVNTENMTDAQWGSYLKNMQNNFKELYKLYSQYQLNTKVPREFQHQY
ncbi:hypothetical protein, partial [Flavobacterium sp. ACAM 123]|uniref:hypothetical protein n=1 Tax=Flavobacterium sp. ACAM 123 TaxID=1189620 RepID=UPI000551AB72